MRVMQIERAKRPVRRSAVAAAASAVALGLSVVGPPVTWAEPAGLTAAEFVRIPERRVDLEGNQQPHEARAAARREAALERVGSQGAAASTSAVSSAAARGRGAHRNQHQGAPLE